MRTLLGLFLIVGLALAQGAPQQLLELFGDEWGRMQAWRQREIDTALVGAVDLGAELRSLFGTGALRTLSPTGRALPFDSRADGRIVGEGAAAVV
ncbi:MAG: beta-ketoacyl synthase N-terminal-like domain-containing protein, partial [Planctomycetota bacterium]|nr:beta-ketoacyl synthase N-terminal-like domain-containing protein [Planctomycetota bacterium]